MTTDVPPGQPDERSTPEELDVFVKYGSVNQRWHAASCERLSPSAMERLALDPDESVRASLLDNWRIPTELLKRMSATNPHLRDRIARHYNAPPEMKAAVPLWQHSSRAVVQYARDVGAAPEVTRRLLELHGNADPGGNLTLGEAHRLARGDAQM